MGINCFSKFTQCVKPTALTTQASRPGIKTVDQPVTENLGPAKPIGPVADNSSYQASHIRFAAQPTVYRLEKVRRQDQSTARYGNPFMIQKDPTYKRSKKDWGAGTGKKYGNQYGNGSPVSGKASITPQQPPQPTSDK